MIETFLDNMEPIKLVSNIELTKDELETLQFLLTLFKPFKDATLFMSSDDNSISLIIPFGNKLKETINEI